MKQRRDAYVARLNGAYATNWAAAGIEQWTGLASFADAETVEVELADGSKQLLTGKHTVISCGGRLVLEGSTRV